MVYFIKHTANDRQSLSSIHSNFPFHFTRHCCRYNKKFKLALFCVGKTFGRKSTFSCIVRMKKWVSKREQIESSIIHNLLMENSLHTIKVSALKCAASDYVGQTINKALKSLSVSDPNLWFEPLACFVRDFTAGNNKKYKTRWSRKISGKFRYDCWLHDNR